MPITARTAIARNEAEGRPWSIYLEEVGRLGHDQRPDRYRLVMPDENGVLPESVAQRRTGVVVTWPVNPHGSGECAILDRLNDAAARETFGCPVVALGFAADQDGRHHRTFQ